MTRLSYDAIVIGSGPNGLAAAITLARAGYSVLVQEAEAMIGGGTRSAELTLPGFMHDVCSAVHPLAIASPFFRSLPLSEHGLEWIHSPAPLAHPFDDAMAVLLEGSVETTADALGRDSMNYRRLMKPLVELWPLLDPNCSDPCIFPIILLRWLGSPCMPSAPPAASQKVSSSQARHELCLEVWRLTPCSRSNER